VKRKLLVIDTETGGLDPAEHAIMSLAAVVYHDGHIDESVAWLIEDPTGVKTVNATNLNGLDGCGDSPWKVVTELKQLLLRHDMRGKVTLAGHNLPFDVGFLQRLYRLADADYDKQFNYGGLCTKTAALLLEQAGRLKIDNSSLVTVCEALGITVDASHDALADALNTAQVLRRLIERIA
jgi:DNA polymerase III subunit epsilon